MLKSNTKSLQIQNAKGFSLIELVVIIAIVGILAALALPSYSSFIAGQRIKTASFDIMAALTMARSEAIKRNADAVITLAGGNWQNGWTIAVGATTLSQQEALPGITITCTPSCNDLTYNLNGRTGNAQTIQINSTNNTNAKRCIGIDLSGRPNSKKGDC